MREHWSLLEPKERQRLGHLISHSHGRPRNLSDRERRELAALVRKLELGRLGRRLAEQASPLPLPRRRRR
jgi:hypothetical protein